MKVDVHLQDFCHRRTGFFQFLLKLVQNMLGVGPDVAFEMRADAGEEQHVAVRDDAAEKRHRQTDVRGRLI